MAFVVPSDKGLHFRFDPWDCCVAAVDTFVAGTAVILGTGNRSLGEYDSVGTIWGPGDIVAAANAAGGMGNFLVSLIPIANSLLRDKINRHPAFAPTTNSTPPSLDGINVSLQEYFTFQPSADGNFPVLGLKAYSDPVPQS